MAPRVLFLGKLVWAHEETKQMLGSISEVLQNEAKSRDELFKDFKEGGRYNDVVAIFYEGSVKPVIGGLDEDMVQALPASCKWVAYKGAGYNDCNVQALKRRGIGFSNTPGAVDEATATTALYLLLATVRNFTWAERHLRAGKFAPIPELEASSSDLSNKTIGILGLGGIGGKFLEMVKPFGMKVLYHNRKPSSSAPPETKYVEDLYDLLRQVDVLSIHMPLSPQTKGLIGEKEIRTMKKGSIIINTGRGPIIDEEALIKALQDGHLGTVGLDVFAAEPKVDQRLLDMPNITLLPHVGTENQDARRKMEVVALTNIQEFLKNGKGPNLVPECQ